MANSQERIFLFLDQIIIDKFLTWALVEILQILKDFFSKTARYIYFILA